ncbi:MAG: crossover junction endodeoxyribonuclease RuvC [Alphaproteobacteria bacterium]|nr:crossover junction endodeoxyribonuclease RuvC [Alphaproteobacteria bacterium]
MKILGIDPGLQKTGWGIIESSGNSLHYVASGIIRPNTKVTMSERLATLYHYLITVIDEQQPAEAAIEETFVNQNPASALKLGQARGVLLMVPALKGISVDEYGANKIKKSVVGNGHASKQQIGMMIKTLLPSCGTLSEDEADALAVAITHAHYRSLSTIISIGK